MDGDSISEVDGRLGCGAVVAGEGRKTDAGVVRDGAGGRHFEDAEISTVEDEHVAVRVNRDVVRLVQLRSLRRSGHAAFTGDSRSGENADGTRGSYSQDAVSEGVGDIDIAARRRGDIPRPQQLVGDGGDDAAGGDAAEKVIGEVGDIEIAGAIGGDS